MHRKGETIINSTQYKIKLDTDDHFINVDNFKYSKKSIFSIPNHWVGLRGISLDENSENISVTVFTWGNTNKVWSISYDVFKDGYFGYVAGK